MTLPVLLAHVAARWAATRTPTCGWVPDESEIEMTEHDPMPQERLDAIQRRVGNTTEGPWAHWRGWNQWDNCIKGDSDEGMYTVAEVISEAGDAQFIAHAREDIPALLAEVERRARSTVTEDMVERAVEAHRETFNAWPVKRSPGDAENRRVAAMRAALDAAFNPREGS